MCSTALACVDGALAAHEADARFLDWVITLDRRLLLVACCLFRRDFHSSCRCFALQVKYGSIDGYLDSIGFDADWRERLRGALLS